MEDKEDTFSDLPDSPASSHYSNWGPDQDSELNLENQLIAEERAMVYEYELNIDKRRYLRRIKIGKLKPLTKFQEFVDYISNRSTEAKELLKNEDETSFKIKEFIDDTHSSIQKFYNYFYIEWKENYFHDDYSNEEKEVQESDK